MLKYFFVMIDVSWLVLHVESCGDINKIITGDNSHKIPHDCTIKTSQQQVWIPELVVICLFHVLLPTSSYRSFYSMPTCQI